MNQEDDSLAVTVSMMNDRTGLWFITERRTRLIRDNLDNLSPKSAIAAREMLATAEADERFWVPKVEYYLVINEIRAKSRTATKAELEAAIEAFTKGAKADGMFHREWVKRTLDILLKIHKG